MDGGYVCRLLTRAVVHEARVLRIVLRVQGTGIVMAVLLMIPLQHQASPHCNYALHPQVAVPVVCGTLVEKT